MTLTCYQCEYDSTMDKQICNATIQTCDEKDTYCITSSITEQNGKNMFSKGCIQAKYCGSEPCDYYEQQSGKNFTCCSITCCNSDKCNIANGDKCSGANKFALSTITMVTLGAAFIGLNI